MMKILGEPLAVEMPEMDDRWVEIESSQPEFLNESFLDSYLAEYEANEGGDSLWELFTKFFSRDDDQETSDDIVGLDENWTESEDTALEADQGAAIASADSSEDGFSGFEGLAFLREQASLPDGHELGGAEEFVDPDTMAEMIAQLEDTGEELNPVEQWLADNPRAEEITSPKDRLLSDEDLERPVQNAAPENSGNSDAMNLFGDKFVEELDQGDYDELVDLAEEYMADFI